MPVVALVLVALVLVWFVRLRLRPVKVCRRCAGVGCWRCKGSGVRMRRGVSVAHRRQ